MASADEIVVEIVVATPDRQEIGTLSLAAGTDAASALEQSGLHSKFAELEWSACRLAVWGEPVDPARVLREGDRLEVLRPLERDPRDARRELARDGQVMSGSSVDER